MLTHILRSGLPLLLAGLLSACLHVPTEETVEALYWPMPPERPRYFHELTIRSSNDVVVETEDQRMSRLLTGASVQGYAMRKPFAVAARGGRIMVTDTGLSGIHVFDYSRRRYFFFGYRLDGKLDKPLDIEIDQKGRVFVVDAKQRRVVLYDSFGLYVRDIPLPADIIQPTGLAISDDGSRIYVVDTGKIDTDEHKIVAYSDLGERLFSIGKRGKAEGEFNLPVDATISHNELYVLDAANFRVQVFDLDGNFKRTWGSVGNGLGQFSRPRSIAADGDGNIYVSDTQFGNIQVFNPQGQLLIALGGQAMGDERGMFTLLAGISVDESNRLYALDQKQRKLEVILRLNEQQGQQVLDHLKPGN